MAQAEEYATCRAACPVHTDTRGYVELVAQGRYNEALDLIRAVNPFPSVCGYICHHPCEQECRRRHVDEAVALRELKRFVAERTREYRRQHRQKPDEPTGKRVAVIGAGPAGLTAARDLAIEGHAVSVFDREEKPGGMLASTIPAYRLPDPVLMEDIEEILSLGIAFHGGVDASTDAFLEKTVDEYDAVIVATGLPKSAVLAGLDGDGVHGAMEFLREARRNEPQQPGKHAVVIGGGNVAMDVARTARRLGAQTVDVVCLEDEEEIPSWPWELEEAVEEGISVHHRWGPTEILRADGKVAGLRTRKVLSVFDAEGRFAPKYDDGVTKDFPGESVIVSIGQRADLAFVADVLELDERGRLRVDAGSGRTSRDNVFACGEVITGPGAAIEAVASGYSTATVVGRYLATGELPEPQEEDFRTLGDLSEQVLQNIVRASRVCPTMVDPVQRVKSFETVCETYSETMARREALRCLNCTGGAECIEEQCAACLTCLRVCPFDVPVVTDVASFPSDLCQACGMCAAECPGEAIRMRRWPPETIPNWVEAALAESSDGVVTFECLEETLRGGESAPGTVLMACTARLSETDILKALEKGASRVIVRACSAEQCRFPGAFPFFAKRMERASRLLEEIGMGDRFEFQPSAEEVPGEVQTAGTQKE